MDSAATGSGMSLDAIRRRLFRPVVLLSGCTRHDGAALQCAYVGTDPVRLTEWTRLLFAGVRVETLGAHPLFRIRRMLTAGWPECSAILWESTRLSRVASWPHPAFHIPGAIHSWLDLSVPIADRFREGPAGFANARRLVRKNRFRYEVTRSPAACRRFYDEMYVPYLRARHSGRERILPLEALFPGPGSFDLFVIAEGDRPAAGAVVHYRNERATLGFFGVLGGAFDVVRRGALGAAYCFVAEELSGRGFRRLDLGLSSPVLTDGITRHKIRLRATLDFSRDPPPGVVFSPLRDGPGLQDFFAHNPFLVHGPRDGFGCVHAIRSGQYSSREAFEKDLDLSRRLGVRRRVLLPLDPASPPPGWLEAARANGHSLRLGRWIPR